MNATVNLGEIKDAILETAIHFLKVGTLLVTR